MYLDAYYKMQVYSRMASAWAHCQTGSTTGAMTIPDELTLCSGTTVTAYYPTTYNSDAKYCNLHPCFGIPFAGIISQLTTYSMQTNNGGACSNLIVGSGTTAPTAADYKVESEITSGLSYVSTTNNFDSTNRCVTYTKVMQNNSGAEITVNEIGLAWPLATEYAPKVARQVLVYREVLENPIVVADGETFSVSITHTFDLPV